MVDRKESNKLFKKYKLNPKKISRRHFFESIESEVNDGSSPEEACVIVIRNMSKIPDYYKRMSKIKKHWEDKDKDIFLDGGSFWDALKNPIGTIKEAFRGAPSKYSYGTQETLDKVGSVPIVGLKIARTPLNSALTGTINAVSLGKWNELVKKSGYDKLYHLALVATLSNSEDVTLEKNEVISVYKSKAFSASTEYLQIGTQPNLTLKLLLERTLKYMGENNFFSYDALNNNCQVFIMSILKANGLNSAAAEKFVYQDFKEVEKGLNSSGFSYVPKLMHKITNLGSVVSRLTGRGTHKEAFEAFQKYVKDAGLDLSDKDATDEFVKFINRDGLRFL